MDLSTAILLFLSTFDTAYLSAGSDRVGQSHYISAGLTDDLNGIFKSRYELGYWSDSINSSSLYGAYQIGLTASNDIIYADFFTGPSLITRPDNRLSSPIEFKHDVGVGVMGKNKVGIGINYSHLSNAGIRQPNLGRNAVQLKLTLPIR